MTRRAGLKKPVDVGNGLVCASLDGNGAWLSLGTYHSLHGFVELTALPAFDERRRGDAAAVRGYRALMVESRYCFLELDAEDWRSTFSTIAPAGARAIEQRRKLVARRGDARAPIVRFRGRIDRPAFAEITETDPPRPTGATTTLRAAGSALHLDAPGLPAHAEIDVAPPSSAWELSADGACIALDPSEAATARALDVTIRCSLAETTGQ
jgi:hypothetical protein